MKNVILYLRVSTAEQKDKGYSLPSQEAAMKTYCESKNYNVIAIYKEDYTGTTFERPEFNKLLTFAKANKSNIDKVLCIKWDRFSRNISEALQMIKKLAKWKIEVNCSEQPLDLAQPQTKMMLSTYLMMGEIESDVTSLRTKDGMNQAANEGRFIGSAPFGYTNTRDEFSNSTITPNEDAKYVVESFNLMAQGIYTYEEVRQIMIKKGLKKHKTSFKNMLQNISYIGQIRVKPHNKQPEKIVDGLHEGIIPKETFIKVQELLNKNSKTIAKPKKKDSSLPLRGHLICKKCGGNLTGEGAVGNGGKYYYYKCQNGCKERFSAREAHEAFSKFLAKLTIDNDQAIMYDKVMDDIFKTKDGSKQSELEKLTTKAIAIEANLTKLEQKFYIEESMDEKSFKRLSEHYNKALTEIITRKDSINGMHSNIEQYFKFGISVFKKVRQAYDYAPIEIKNKIIGSIFPEKLVYSKKNYRTNIKPNSMLCLLFNTNNLESVDKEKAADDSGLSYKAPPLGLEPRTP